jgi:hypothetical protein
VRDQHGLHGEWIDTEPPHRRADHERGAQHQKQRDEDDVAEQGRALHQNLHHGRRGGSGSAGSGANRGPADGSEGAGSFGAWSALIWSCACCSWAC